MATRRKTEELIEKRTIPGNAVPLMSGPPEALLWVLRGGLTPEQANDEYGFRWHEDTRRVLCPVPGGFVGRAVHGERPKYIMSGNATYFSLTEGRPGTKVVVEDILSAIAVNRAGWASIAVLGTGITSDLAARISAPVVAGWFDPDAAGTKAWVRLRKRMALHPCQLIRVKTDRDPKNIHRAEIAKILEHLHD